MQCLKAASKLLSFQKEVSMKKREATLLASKEHGFYFKSMFIAKHSYAPAGTRARTHTKPFNNLFLLDSLLYTV